MPKSDNLKDRLNELFSSVEAEGFPEARIAPSQTTPPAAAPGPGDISEAVFENLAVGMLLTGIDGRFLQVNDSFCEILGYTREEILGRNFQSLTFEEDVQIGADAMRDMLGGKSNSARIQKRYVHKDNRLIWVELNITLVRELDGKPLYFVVVAQDITRQRKTAALLEERVQELAVFNEIIRSVAQKIDLNDALEATYQYVLKLMPLDAFIVALYDENSNSVQYPLVYDEGVRYAPVTAEFAPDTRIGQAIEAGKPIMLNRSLEELAQETATQMAGTGLGNLDKPSASLLYIPLKLGEQTVGVMSVQSYQLNAYTEQHVALMTNIANQVVVAIQNAKNFSRMQTALAATQQSQELVSGVINASPDWIFVKDLEHRFVLVNESFANALGRAREDFIGRTDLEMGFAEETVMGNDLMDIHGYWWDDQRVLDTGEPQTTTGEPNIVAGKTHYYDTYKAPLYDAQGKIWGLFGYARDVTEREVLLSDTEALYEGSARIMAATTIDQVLQSLVASTPLRQFESGSLLVFDRAWTEVAPNTGLLAAAWERSGQAPAISPGAVFNLLDLPLTRIAKADAPVFISDVLADERLDVQTRLALSGLGRSVGLFPLMAVGKWIGWVAMFSPTPLEMAPDQVRKVHSLAGQAATAIQSQRLQEDMQARLQELTNLQRLMSREAWSAGQSQGTAAARGYLFDKVSLHPVDNDHAPVFEKPGDGNLADGKFADGKFADGKHTDGNGHLPHTLSGSFFDQPRMTSLMVRGEPIGMLGVQTAPGQTLAPEDEAFLEAISEQVSQALERARLMEQTQRSAVELQAVAEVSTASSTILDPKELLQTVVDLTERDFGLYHVHVYLVDELQTHLVLSAGAGEVGRSMTSEGWSIPISQTNSIVAATARSRQGYSIQDVRKEPAYLSNPLLPDTKSELAVPLVVGDRLLGVFDVQSDAIGRFGDEDIRTYTTLASQVAVALQDAQLYTEQLATVERLRELDNMKSAFLANMSHELRTPLNSILGFTQVIEEGIDGPLTDMMVGDLDLIEKNGKHLLNLINDVLDMAKIEAGRLSLSPEPLNLYDLMHDVLETTGALAREKDLTMRLEADPLGDWTVMADHVRMRQIFINLVGNAVKFTDHGGVSIQLDKLYRKSEAESDRVQICIHDTGIGIPPFKLEEIFQAFSQVDNTTTRKAGGTGLGLPISRRLVELHGGRLWAESQGVEGAGTTIFLELPVGITDDSAAE